MNRIKELRKEKGLTLEEVAKALGVTNMTISRYENGKREPKLAMWQKLADFFGVPVPYLQGLEPNYEEITDKTWQAFASKLNNIYFNDDKENELAERTKKLINKYLYLADIKEKPNKKSSNEKYWYKYFGFLLSNDLIVEVLNYEVYSKTPPSHKVKHLTEYSEGHYINLDMVIYSDLEVEINNKFTTDIGAYYDLKYSDKFAGTINNLGKEIRFISSKRELKDAFQSCLNTLNNYKDSFLNDFENGNFKEFIDDYKKDEINWLNINNEVSKEIYKVLSKLPKEKLNKMTVEKVKDLLQSQKNLKYIEKYEDMLLNSEFDRLIFDLLIDMKKSSK